MSKGAVPAFEGIQRDFPVGAESCGPGSSLNPRKENEKIALKAQVA